MKRWLILALCLALLLIEPYLAAQRFSLQMEQAGPVSVSEFFLRFLGEIRYSLASYLWLDVEIYHHEVGATTISSHIGVLDPKKVGEIIGLCRLVTKLDPHFVQAYDVGSWRLIEGLGKFKDGMSFLKEGIANNPDSDMLYDDAGLVYFFDLKDCPDAIPYLEKAVEYSGNNLMNRKDNMRMLGACYDKEGEKDKALDLWRAYLQLVPGDTGAKQRIKKLTGG